MRSFRALMKSIDRIMYSWYSATLAGGSWSPAKSSKALRNFTDRNLRRLPVLVPADDHLLVENIAVAPNRQGSGIGALLLNKAEEQAHASRLPEIRPYTNQAMTENLTSYPRHGYHETHRTTQDGYRRVYFVKAIDSTWP